MEFTAARLDGSFLGRRGPSQDLVWLSPLLSEYAIVIHVRLLVFVLYFDKLHCIVRPIYFQPI